LIVEKEHVDRMNVYVNSVSQSGSGWEGW